MTLLATPTVWVAALEPTAFAFAVTRTLTSGLLRTLVLLRRFWQRDDQQFMRINIQQLLNISLRDEEPHRRGELLVDGAILRRQRLEEQNATIKTHHEDSLQMLHDWWADRDL